ncbi:hypothetical protein CFC21_109421 [Triticum aestivum]|uniref:3'-5' exonuclease domain-containing protein n=2 Tax=Triticum aestivum TaxID=4565 RepID=A0A3B6TFG2_WHEAT|nr:hypothetical protein CFC21_109421 [Triticum aestivum]
MAAEKLVTSVDFEDDMITATVTSSGDAVKAWLRQIRYVYRWVYHKLILCVGRRCLVFQLLHADFVPRALHRFLANPDFRFVGVGVQDDAGRLSNDHGLEVANAVDLRDLAADEMRRPWLRQAGLKDVAGVVMGANLNKPRRVRMGPWDACRLSQEQIQYACIDAFVSFEVGRKLLTGDYSSSDEEDY